MLLALKEMILEKIIPIDYVKKGRKARLLAGLKNKKSSTSFGISYSLWSGKVLFLNSFPTYVQLT